MPLSRMPNTVVEKMLVLPGFLGGLRAKYVTVCPKTEKQVVALLAGVSTVIVGDVLECQACGGKHTVEKVPPDGILVIK